MKNYFTDMQANQTHWTLTRYEDIKQKKSVTNAPESGLIVL